MRRSTKVALVLAVSIAVAKRAHPKAKIIWLIKRWVGALLLRLLPTPKPQIMSGTGCTSKVAKALTDLGCRKPLVVTDDMLVSHGLVKKCTDSLQEAGLQYTVFQDVVPNPHSELVEQGFEIYQDKGCDSIIAFGGGSPMDVAKIIGAKVCNPKPIPQYQGAFMVTTLPRAPQPPPLIAIPTTAGTGSETSIGAVITMKEAEQKIVIADLSLVPAVAVLDPDLLVKLPKHVTAATGMDALTHAIESFVSYWSTAHSRQLSLQASEKIFRNLLASYKDGSDKDARQAMLLGSFEAGAAFTKAGLGYVHAIAHQFGGMFHTPHGVANAMLLPHVLEFYLQDEDLGTGPCTKLLCQLAQAAGVNSEWPQRDMARMLVRRIFEMNEEMQIDSEVKDMKAFDVEIVARRALNEAHGSQHSLVKPMMWLLDAGYPVPKYMNLEDCCRIISKVLPLAERKKWLARQCV